MLCLLANSALLRTRHRAIVISQSHSTPAGLKPASVIKSIVVSSMTPRVSTPPACAREVEKRSSGDSDQKVLRHRHLNRPATFSHSPRRQVVYLTRGGHTEAAHDLMTPAGFKPAAGVLCELTRMTMARGARAPECIDVNKHNMALVTIEDRGIPSGT